MYKKIYRCKLCRKIVIEEIQDEAFQDVSIKMLNDPHYNKNNIHFCDNYKIGMLEFVGIEKENVMLKENKD